VYTHKLNVSTINFQKRSPVINIGERLNYAHLAPWILMRCSICSLIRKLSKVMVQWLALLECSSMVAHNYYDLLALAEGDARMAWLMISIIERLVDTRRKRSATKMFTSEIFLRLSEGQTISRLCAGGCLAVFHYAVYGERWSRMQCLNDGRLCSMNLDPL